MSFHPDSNLPGCMMPDGGDCCAGHAAVVEDWHKQRRQIDTLVKALQGIAEFCSGEDTTLGALSRLASIRNTAINMLAHVGSVRHD